MTAYAKTMAFRDVELAVGPGVFTPQPETSSLIDWCVAALREAARPLIVDLCTGSGTVALCLAHELPSSTVHAVELDPVAAGWAQLNADRRADSGDKRTLIHVADAGSCLPELTGTCDLVVSNPPYVALTEAHIPRAEVLAGDPAVALWAGDDGLDVIRLVAESARRLLRVGGLLAIEHSDRQGTTAPAVLDGAHWSDVTDHPDDDGLPRFVTAIRRDV